MKSFAAPTSLDLRDDGAYVFHHPPKFTWNRWPSEAPVHRWKNYHFYVHVPFCRKICSFCTFERQQLRAGSISWFAQALERELGIVERLDDFSQARLKSVYLGGGTASLLPNDVIGRLIGRLRQSFGLVDHTEITLECEPGTKQEGDFSVLRAHGVNRISLGFQSFQDHHLRALNRGHNVETAVAAFQAARRAGFENIHLDLMYGLPGQTMEEWQESVSRALDLQPTHLSAYRLIVFDSEQLARKLRNGACSPLPPAEEIEAMRQHLVSQLTAAGYHRYSLTEYCRDGFECRYVISNWDGSDYLGFGPGSYSRNRHALWEDDVIHEYYTEALSADRRPVGRSHEMSGRQALVRDLAMGFCLLRVNLAELEQRSGVTIDSDLSRLLAEFVDAGLIEREGDFLCLTELGIRHASAIMRHLVAA